MSFWTDLFKQQCANTSGQLSQLSGSGGGSLTHIPTDHQGEERWYIRSDGGGGLIASKVAHLDGHVVLMSSDGTLPTSRYGWEGTGGANTDGPCREAEQAQANQRLADWARDVDRGETIASAISAVHAQQSRNGRPSRFIPDLD